MNKPHSPHPDWRNSFEFKPVYPEPVKTFALDPVLVKYSTNAQIHNLRSSVPQKK